MALQMLKPGAEAWFIQPPVRLTVKEARLSAAPDKEELEKRYRDVMAKSYQGGDKAAMVESFEAHIDELMEKGQILEYRCTWTDSEGNEQERWFGEDEVCAVEADSAKKEGGAA